MSEERFELRLEHFVKAVAALQTALQMPEDEFMRDSIIKRFELAFETARKAMRQWLMEQQEVTSHSTKKEVMEAAFKTGLIADADLWNELGSARNDTSHEYDQSKATAIVAFVRDKGFSALSALVDQLKQRG